MLLQLKLRHPDLGVTAVYKTEVPDLYEVQIGNHLGYVQRGGRYLCLDS